MRHARLGLLAALAAATIAGCHSSDSSSSDGADGGDIAQEFWNPSDIYFGVNVEAADDVTAKVRVEMKTLGPGTRFTKYHLLVPGDVLSACVGAVCKSLTRAAKDVFSYIPIYVADLPYVGETPYTISLARQGEVVAPNTVITLPVPFTVLAPPPGLQVTDGQQVTVQWSPPNNGRASVRSDTRCDHQDGGVTTRPNTLHSGVDTGTATISIDEIFEWPAFVPSTPARILRCDILLEVSLTRVGTVDSAFKHGHIGADITRSVTLDYTPSQR